MSFEDELDAFEKEISELPITHPVELNSNKEAAKDLKSLLKKSSSTFIDPTVNSTSISISEEIVGKPTINPDFFKSKEVTESVIQPEIFKVTPKRTYDAPIMERSDRTTKVRQVGNKIWKDETLDEWPDNDFRIFVGNLDKETTDKSLELLFQKYSSFNMAKVVKMNKKIRNDGKKAAFNVRREVCKGYGFVSFSDPKEMLKAIKEMNGKFCQERPMQIKRGKWSEREVNNVRKKQKFQKKSKKFI